MSMGATSKVFESYANLPARVPTFIWIGLRALVLAITAGIGFELFTAPDLGIKLFWGVAIPIVPVLFAIAPGLWRQVCPMAALNQIPRATGFALGRTLPDSLRDWAFAFAVVSFVAFVGLRMPLFDHNAAWLGIGVIAALALAFVGGIAFKGRSGWCGTFCPLGPIQRFYGQAPVVMVRNGYCPTCVGCQKNCYDFNPAAAIFIDLDDEDPAYVGQRRFFMAMMPGVLCGYFLQGPDPSYGEPLHAIIFVAAALASAGLYQAIVSFFRINPFRMANLFAGLSLIIFYAFAGPVFVDTIGQLAQIQIPGQVVDTSRVFGVLLALAVYMQGRHNETIYRKAVQAAQSQRSDQRTKSPRDGLASSAGAPQVVDLGSGIAFPVAGDQSLLEAMEAADININFGCRSGVCGADPVAVCEGHENLSVADSDERATLERLGLLGKARLACVCRVSGPVRIDRDLRNAKAFEPAEAEEVAQKDLAALGIRRVVIIGNGAAGLGVAEALRRVSADVEITVVSDEFHHFYNRMAIGRVVYGRTAMDGLQLLPDEWYAEHQVEVWRNTVVRSIGRRAKLVRLATGDSLPYDRLVLAMGARAVDPAPNYSNYPNAFVLRSAADAQAIRAHVQSHRARRAVVIGGGVLGIEAADALRHLGLDVTILQRAHWLMDRQLDSNGAAHLAEYLRDVDIRVENDATIASFEVDSDLNAVCLADGRKIKGDLFVACTGVVPNIELAKECGLAVGRGIKVDGSMRTVSDPSIFAVGDVAEAPGGAAGLWTVAAAQAKAAVAAMTGEPKAYAPAHPLVQLKCDGIDLRSFGEIEPKAADEAVDAPPHGEAWWRFVLRGGALVGALYVGPPGTSRDFTRVIQAGTDITPALDDLRAGRIEVLRRLLDGTYQGARASIATDAKEEQDLVRVSEPDSTIVPLPPADEDVAAEAASRSVSRARWAVAAVVLLAIAGAYWALPQRQRLQEALNRFLPNSGPTSEQAKIPPPTPASASSTPVTIAVPPAPALAPPTAVAIAEPPSASPSLPAPDRPLDKQAAVPPPPVQQPSPPPPVAGVPPLDASPPPAAKPPAARPDDAAIKRLDTTIELNPRDGDAVYKRGQLFAKSGDFVRAIKDFDEAIRLDPKHADAFNNRCWAHAVVGELQAALNDCNQALQLQPRYVDALDSRGLVNLKIGLPGKAIADYDAALQINPRLASSLYGRGIAKRRSGNSAGGNQDIAAAKAIKSDIAEEFAGYGIR
jgi:nitrite reductase (NADH) large subunit